MADPQYTDEQRDLQERFVAATLPPRPPPLRPRAPDDLSAQPAPAPSADLIVEAYATREEWLSARAGVDKVYASEAAGMLGVHPQVDAWTLWSRKVEGIVIEETAPELQRGNRWEPAVLADYEDASGARVIAPGEYFGKPRHIITLSNRRCPWLRESPDAFAVDRLGTFGQVEAKTALRAGVWAPEPGLVIDRWDDAHAEIVPPHFAVQGYVHLIVSGRPWVDLTALVPTGGWLSVRYVRLLQDLETQEQLEESLAAWRERHLLRGEPPAIDGSEACNRHLARKFPGLGKKKPERLADVEEIALMRRLAALRAQAKRIDFEAKGIANTLANRADGHRLLLGKGKGPYGQPQRCIGREGADLADVRRVAPDLIRRGAPFLTFNTYGFGNEDNDGEE